MLFFPCIWYYLSCMTFSRKLEQWSPKEIECPDSVLGSIDQQTNFDDLQPILKAFVSFEMLVVTLKSISCCHIWANGISRVLWIKKQLYQHYSRLWKFHQFNSRHLWYWATDISCKWLHPSETNESMALYRILFIKMYTPIWAQVLDVLWGNGKRKWSSVQLMLFYAKRS